MLSSYRGSPLMDTHDQHGVSSASHGSPAVRVVVADYPAVLRAGISSLLSAQADMEVVVSEGTADSCLEALRSLRARRDLVLVVGLGLPGERGSEWLIRSVREQFPSIPILASAAHPDDLAISQALFTGADGFVSKDVDSSVFVESVRRAARREVVLEGVPETWVATIADNVERTATKEPVLTPRETEVLVVAAEGLTARQIGHRLGVRERTVTTHLGRIYRKLGAAGRVAALAAATEFGVLASGPRR
jgi:two-component system, NarL family, nitrate/nitrite response regulator NarL